MRSTDREVSAVAEAARPVRDAKQVERTLRTFNTWAFKREQPTEPELLTSAVSAAVMHGSPLRFVLYWGKGPRARIGSPDIACLDYLAQMAGRIQAVHRARVVIMIIATDTHALHNGHSAASVNGYYRDIALAARQRGFAFCRLSAVVEQAEVEPALVEEDLPRDLEAKLQVCAAKWYRGEGSVEEGAVQYFKLNLIEKRAIEIVFPDAIFVTFNSREFRDLFPRGLPVFYMYSLRKGVSVKPWFLMDEAEGAATGGSIRLAGERRLAEAEASAS